MLQPVLDRVQRGFFGRATAGIEPAEIAAAAREILDGRTLTRPELGRLLAERWPDRDPGALASSAQFVVAVVHPPPSGTWGTGGKTPFVLAESWLGRPLATDNLPDTLILRYLAAFGPASAGTWTIDRTQPTLTVELFGRLRAGAGAGHRAALDEEAAACSPSPRRRAGPKSASCQPVEQA